MKKVSVIAAAVAATLSAGSALAGDVEFNGYMRAGTAVSSNGVGDVSFADKRGIGRLGNESDNYSEFGLAKNLKVNDEQTWRIESMIAAGRDGAQGWEDGQVNIAQFAVKAKGVLEFDRDATLWAGKTYYQRKDIHITDFYFLNTSGTGGGVENISIGEQKLSVALLQDGETAKEKAGYIADVRLANIGLWEGASLELAAAYNFETAVDGKDSKGKDGVLGTAIVHQGLSNGFNQTVLQYGTAGYGVQAANLWGAGAYYDRSGDHNDAKGYRVLNWGVINLGESWEMGHQLAYLAGNDIGTSKVDIHQYSVVARPMYKWNDTMRTVFEAGYNAGKNDSETDFATSKFTISQAWAMGDSFWSRPEIRVFGSYLKDHEGKNAALGNKDNDLRFGVQVEAWW